MNYKHFTTLLLTFALMFSEKDCSSTTTASTNAPQEITKATTSNLDSMDLGTFSMSLAVKDIKKSYEFYQKLGFEHLPGGGAIDQKWMILKNGDIKLGLFQGMFPQNTLTFNPKNGRQVAKKLKEEKVEFLFQMGLDKKEGACSFSFLDPDGNSILVDQH